MDIEGISGAATIALTSTFVFVLVAKSWHLINRSIGSSPSFSDSIMREAAQRFRDEFDRLTNEQSTYLGAGLLFVLLFVAAYVLNAERLFEGYPKWQLYLLLAALAGAALLAAWRLLKTILDRRQIQLLRDANIAIGHQLQSMATGLGRAYHDVETSSGIIDHMIIGQNGAYAITVVARPSRKNGTVELQGNELQFRPPGATYSVVDTGEKVASLEREFRRLLDHRVRIRSVIAIPGWEISEQPGEDNLLVNEKNLPMLRGWKSKADHLMNEDVDALHKLLTSRCKLTPRNTNQ